MTIVSLFGARRMGKSVIQRMYMEYIKEKIMNEQERALDLQLGDALAELESLKAERDALKANRDEYQVAADKLAMENKILRDTKSFDILQESVEYNELKIEFQNYRNEMREEVVSLEKERDALLAENEKLSDLWSLIKAERDALKATLAQPEQERVETYIHEFTKQPHPGDFGIPRGHWWQAKQYADSLQPEQEPDVVNRMNALQDPLPPTETKTRAANSAQPEQEPLTDEDIKTMYLRAHDNNMYMGWLAVAVAFARAIEAKLKEKNT